MDHFYNSIPGHPNGLPNLYSQIVAYAKRFGCHFVEVGCFRGASAAAMCVEIVNSGKKIKFDCIDIWQDEQDYEFFLKNLDTVKSHFNSIRMPSIEAATLYSDESLDFVCIDASHDYEDIKADINAWLPKIRPGGILAGDDYLFPGVYKAVNEAFPKYRGTSYTWVYRKPPKFL